MGRRPRRVRGSAVGRCRVQHRPSHCVEPATSWLPFGNELVSAPARRFLRGYDIGVARRRIDVPRDLTPEKLSFAIGVLLVLVFLAVWVFHLT